MIISRSAASAEWAFDGKAYYFCANVCCEAFKANPRKFLHKTKSPAGAVALDVSGINTGNSD